MEPRAGCPTNAAVEIPGDPWTMLLLRDVMLGGRRHFRELLHGSEEGIASDTLSDRLERLVAAGLPTKADTGRHCARFPAGQPGLQPFRAGSGL